MVETQNGIFRKKRRDFTIVTNQLARDKTISLKAKGLYLLIQSYIDIPNFILYKNFLRKSCKEGRDAFDGAWNELKRSGYLVQYRLRDKESQRYYYEYDLLDIPEPPKEEKDPCTGNPYMEPDTEKPCMDNPCMDNPPVEKPCAETPYGLTRLTDNKTYSNNTYSDHQPTNHTTVGLVGVVKENINYDDIGIIYPHIPLEVVDELCMIMAEVLAMSDSISIKINGCPISVSDIKRRYREITMEHIAYTVESLQKAGDVRNPKGYAVAVLYNSVSILNINTELQIAASYNT